MESQIIIPQDKIPLKIGATGMDAITQNIRMIVQTLSYSIPLDRAFANDGRAIDSPAPQDAGRRIGDMIDTIEKYEPRVKVRKIEFVYADQKTQLREGTLVPKIFFSLRSGVEL